MNAKTFDKLVEELDGRCKCIIAIKRPEYTEGRDSIDVLHNFKTVAQELGVSPLVVAYIFFRKHIASIGQYCGGKYVSSEPIRERLCDARNYIDLIWALIQDDNIESVNSKFVEHTKP